MSDAQRESTREAAAERKSSCTLAETVSDSVALAYKLVQEGQSEKAIEILDAVIAKAPDALEAWRAKALVLSGLGRGDEAVAAFDTALEQVGLEPNLLLEKAWFQLWLNDFTHARETFDRLVTLEPQNLAAWVGKGWSFLYEEQLEEALQCAERAIVIDERSTPGHSLRGDILLLSERWAEAFHAFVEAARCGPEQFDSSNWAARGDVFLQRQQPGFALKAYEQAITQDPGNPEGWHGKGIVLKGREDPEGALAAFEHASEVDETFIAGFLEAGNLCIERSDLDRALGFFERAKTNQPDDPRPWQAIGSAYDRFGRHDEAQAAYERATTIAPNDAESWNMLGNSLYSRYRLDEASRSYERAIEIQPDYALWHSNLSFVRVQQKRFDEAVQSIDRAIELEPDNGSFWLDKLWILTQTDRIEDSQVDALADLALEKIGPNTDQQPYVADFLAECGHLTRARNLMHSIILSGTDDERERLVRAEILLRVGDSGPALDMIRNIDPARLRGYDPVTFSFLHLLADRLAGAQRLSEELLMNFFRELTHQVDFIDAGALWSLKGVNRLIAHSDLPVLEKFALATLIDLQEAKVHRSDLSFFAEFRT